MVLQLLVQVPDAETLSRLLEDGAPLAEVANAPDVHVFIIEDGRVREALR